MWKLQFSFCSGVSHLRRLQYQLHYFFSYVPSGDGLFVNRIFHCAILLDVSNFHCILFFFHFDLKIFNILAPNCTWFSERKSGVKMFHSSTLKRMSNILMFRRMINDMYKEIIEVSEAMPWAKPYLLTLYDWEIRRAIIGERVQVQG